jgi:hypothetical protein
MAEFLCPFGQIPLEVAAEPGTVIEHAQQNRVGPLAVGQKHTQGAVVKIQMPEAIDILAFKAADFTPLVTALSRLGARAVNRTAPGPLDQAMLFHEPQHRQIRRHGPQFGLLFDQDSEVVGVELVGPTGVLAVLGGEPFGQLGAQGPMPSVIGADLAFENPHGAFFGRQGFVLTTLDVGPQRGLKNSLF